MLEVNNLAKSYQELKVLNDVSFSCSRGQIVSLTGNNGSGKTTLFRIMLGLLEPDQGEVSYNHRKLPLRKTGYLPEERSMYYDCPVERQLRLFGRLKGMKDSELDVRISYWLNVTSAQQYRQLPPARLSKGNQQKIQLIIALLHDPEIIIMDEPWTGLDQDNAELFSRIILQQKHKGKTVILSSHLHQEVLNICDRFMFLKDGRISIDVTAKRLLEDERTVVEVESSGKVQAGDCRILFQSENHNSRKFIMENDREAVKLVSQMQGEGISSVTVRKLTVRDYAEVENAVFD